MRLTSTSSTFLINFLIVDVVVITTLYHAFYVLCGVPKCSIQVASEEGIIVGLIVRGDIRDLKRRNG